MKSAPRKRVKASRKAPAAIDAKASPRLFPIVGIGASAGGLEAFSELLRHLPEKTGMAFVLVQHLDPKHGSALQPGHPFILLAIEDVTEKKREGSA